MTDRRARSEFRLRPIHPAVAAPGEPPEGLTIRPVQPTDREAAAVLLLDACRGTIDDEGEDADAALEAIDDSLRRLQAPHSVVLVDGDSLVAMSFVVVVDGLMYIDPVATAADRKGRDLARAAVTASLRSLGAAGVDEVGAVITDGNTPSARLFARLGFVRRGTWPPS